MCWRSLQKAKDLSTEYEFLVVTAELCVTQIFCVTL